MPQEDPLRVLFVDDDELALNLIERVFDRDDDIEVLTCGTPRKALEKLLSAEFDVVVSDYKMPEMNGLQFLARVRELNPAAARILLTAYPDVGVAVEGINEGLLYLFISKPWSPADMRISVRRAGEAKRAQDKAEPPDHPSWRPVNAEAEMLAAVEKFATAFLGELQRAAGRSLDAVIELDRVVNEPDAEISAASVKGPLAETSDATGRLWAMIQGLRCYGGELDERATQTRFRLEEAVEDALYRLGEATGIEVVRDLRETSAIQGRRPEVVQAILNVLLNATEALQNRPDARVTVRTWEKEGVPHLLVADNGPGVDAKDREAMFDAFVTSKRNHLGLGLFIARRVIEAHDGEIEIGEAQGTHVVIRFGTRD